MRDQRSLMSERFPLEHMDTPGGWCVLKHGCCGAQCMQSVLRSSGIQPFARMRNCVQSGMVRYVVKAECYMYASSDAALV